LGAPLGWATASDLTGSVRYGGMVGFRAKDGQWLAAVGTRTCQVSRWVYVRQGNARRAVGVLPGGERAGVVLEFAESGWTHRLTKPHPSPTSPPRSCPPSSPPPSRRPGDRTGNQPIARAARAGRFVPVGLR
jgi:hypothetical protein